MNVVNTGLAQWRINQGHDQAALLPLPQLIFYPHGNARVYHLSHSVPQLRTTWRWEDGGVLWVSRLDREQKHLEVSQGTQYKVVRNTKWAVVAGMTHYCRCNHAPAILLLFLLGWHQFTVTHSFKKHLGNIGMVWTRRTAKTPYCPFQKSPPAATSGLAQSSISPEWYLHVVAPRLGAWYLPGNTD